MGPGPRLMKKIIYRAAVSERLRNTGLEQSPRGTVLLQRNSTEYVRHKFERVLRLTGVTHNVRRCKADRIFTFSLTPDVNYHELITFSQTKRIIQGHYPI